jgi:two-component system alkaline phosphatase synthesis response regulator PhoP
MPKLDGFETCKRIRAKKEYENVPIVFLTAKSGELNEIKGLELGANDYIQKSISPNKLILRVKSNLRKAEGITSTVVEPNRIKCGPIDIDKEKYEIFIDGDKKNFPKKSLRFFIFLLTIQVKFLVEIYY